MAEEKFELMYRFPRTEEHIPLPAALDYLYWAFTELQDKNIELEQANRELAWELNSLESTLKDHISLNH